MSDLTALLQQVADRTDAGEMLAPRDVRRAGGRRRSHLVVATASCVVLGAIAATLLIRGVVRDEPPIEPAGASFAGPPPRGTSPTGSVIGELVALVELQSAGTWVYADGRIINASRTEGSSETFTGYVVRRLTPSGVAAVRSYVLDHATKLVAPARTNPGVAVRYRGRIMSVRTFHGCSDESCPALEHPETWLPKTAWADATYEPFVPYSYLICVQHPRRVSPTEVLPNRAANILFFGPPSTLAVRRSAPGSTCRERADNEARAVADAMDAARPTYVPADSLSGLAYQGPSGTGVMFEPVLPHRDTYCTRCG